MYPVALLAGGLATRLRPLTEKIPKSLVEVNGEPFLAHQLRLFRSRGIERVVLCVGHLGERIQEFAGDGSRFGLRVDYSYDGPTLQGTAGALRNARALLGGTFFVAYGDSYLECDYGDVTRAFDASGKLGLMTVFRNEGQWDTSNVVYEAGRILVYDKKQRTERMRHIDWGLGVFRDAAFDLEETAAVSDLAAVYGSLLQQGELAAYEVERRFYEIGSFSGIEELAGYLMQAGGAGGSPAHSDLAG